MGKRKNENIHDKFFKSSFSIKEVALGFVYEFLPTEISSVIQPNTFSLQSSSYVDKNLSEKFSDIIYSVKTTNETEIYLSFLFEHKSAPDKYIALQLLRYILNGWGKQLKEKKELHLILPIIVYHGQQTWKPKKVKDLIVLPNSTFKKFVPNFNFEYIDIHRFTEKRLLAIANFIMLRNTMMTLKFGRNETYLLKDVQKIFIGAEQIDEHLVGTNFLESIFVYLVRCNSFDGEKLNQIIEILDNPVKEMVMTAYDRLIEQGELQKSIFAVKNMLSKGFDVQLICEIQGVSQEFVNKIKKELEK